MAVEGTQERLGLAKVFKQAWFMPLMVITGFVIIYGLIYAPWGDSSAPAWVQAIGSIAAILAAWLIPQRHERLRRERQRIEMVASVGWLALMGRNQLQAAAEIIDASDPNDLRHWKYVGGASDSVVLRDAANAVPIESFIGSDISYLINLRQALGFAVDCTKRLHEWHEDNAYLLSIEFPMLAELEHHLNQINWVWEGLGGVSCATQKIS